MPSLCGRKVACSWVNCISFRLLAEQKVKCSKIKANIYVNSTEYSQAVSDTVKKIISVSSYLNSCCL